MFNVPVRSRNLNGKTPNEVIQVKGISSYEQAQQSLTTVSFSAVK